MFDRIETQIKQLIREAEIKENIRPSISINAASQLLLATCEGKIRQLFEAISKLSPPKVWQEQWQVLMQGFFKKTMSVNISN